MNTEELQTSPPIYQWGATLPTQASPAFPFHSTTMTLNDLDLFLVNLDGWFGKHNMASLAVQQTASVSYKHRETRPSAANVALPVYQHTLN